MDPAGGWSQPWTLASVRVDPGLIWDVVYPVTVTWGEHLSSKLGFSESERGCVRN